MSIAGFGVRKPVVANLVMMVVIGAGLVFGIGLTREFFPEVSADRVSVTAPYPGAAPEEIEQSLAVKIENAIYDLDNVKEINSTASEGLASVVIEFEDGLDIDAAVADVKREIDALQDLPENADRIVVNKIEPNLPTIVLSLYGDRDEREMKQAIRSIRDDLEQLPGMGDLVISGVRTDEVMVEVRPEAVIEHRLSLPEISRRINEGMIELPGGSVRGQTSNITIRTLGADDLAADVRRIVVKADGDGRVIRLGDIAEVRDSFVDIDLRQRVNGAPANSITVYRVGDDDAVAMAELVKAYVAGREGEAFEPTVLERFRTFAANGQAKRSGEPLDPAAVSERFVAYELGRSRADIALPGEIILTTDLARFIVGRLDLLTRNAVFGGILVFATLLLLLNWRISFWVAAGLGISLLGTLAVMHFTGTTLNLLTMFGLIIVIGILVDDAIVVAENISARHEAGEPATEAAIKGADQVAWPVVATVLTTIAAFLPLTIIGGQIGDFLRVLPIVVICALSVSLLECLFILPSHMAHSLKANDSRGKKGWLSRIESRYDVWRDKLFSVLIIPAYVKTLHWALRRRYLTSAIAIFCVMLSVSMVMVGWVKFTFLPNSDAETVNIELKMPIGTPASVTDRYVRQIEAASLAQPEVSSAFAQVGAVGSLEGEGESQAPHIGQVILELKPTEERELPADEVQLAIQRRLGPLPGIKSLRFEEAQGGPSGPPISIAVVGDDADQIAAVVEKMKSRLAEFDGVFSISDDADGGQRELRFKLRPGANELGFTTASLAQQMQGAVFGLEAFTFAGDREDVDVRVIFPEHIRRSLAEVESLHVISPQGEAVPVSEVAEITEEMGYSTVRRLDRKRAVTVSADVDTDIANASEVRAIAMPEFRQLVAQYPGLALEVRGQQKDMAESFASLPLGMLVAAALIYVILAWLFNNALQPLVVMAAIPFASIGMILGHWVFGFEIAILSLIGFIALAGIVVNDSLIFMEFFNHKRRTGMGVYDAAVDAGRARLRAILLTTITTALGLLPLLLETSFQATFLKPMAITIACGLISATAIILIVLPCFLLILADLKRWLAAVWSGRLGADTTLPGFVPEQTA